MVFSDTSTVNAENRSVPKGNKNYFDRETDIVYVQEDRVAKGCSIGGRDETEDVCDSEAI